jgi:hypothetical protein
MRVPGDPCAGGSVLRKSILAEWMDVQEGLGGDQGEDRLK